MKKSLSLLLTLCASLLLASQVHAQKFDELGKTPQMGWNSWNKFGCNINEQLIRETADAMVKTGMKEAGYQYVNIDDCWHGERDALGNPQPNAERFPSGMKALADYVHSKGLKLGIYSDVGDKTCGGHFGSRGHEYQDAKTYADWGIDYVKYDWCNAKGLNPEGAYSTMRDAIKASGRPMLFSMCEWGDNKPWEWAGNISHSWRTTGDIYLCWDCEFGHGSWSSWGVLRILDKQSGLRKYSGPGHWNDMDMLEVGNGLTEAEDRSHFSIWAIMDSPLISGNDLRKMTESARKILTNKDVIAINQDSLGVQALRVMGGGKVEVYVKPLANDEWAVMFLNRADEASRFEFKWADHYINDDLSSRVLEASKTQYTWLDLWSKAKGTTAQNFNQVIPAHDVVIYRLTPKK